MENNFTSPQIFGSQLKLNVFNNPVESGFADFPPEEKGIAVNQYIKQFVEENGITDENEIRQIKDKGAELLAKEKVTLGINRYRPTQEEASELYPTQPSYRNGDKLEDVIKRVDTWKVSAEQQANNLRPADKEDIRIDLEDRSNSIIRDAAAKSNKTGQFWDKSSRAIEGFVKPFTDLYDKKWSDRYFAESLAENPEYDRDFSSDFAGGFGQAMSTLAIGFGMSAIGQPELIPAVLTGVYGAQYTKNAYEEEMKRSGNEEKAINSAINQIPSVFFETFSDTILLHGGSTLKGIGKKLLEAPTLEAKRAILKASIPTIGKEATKQFISESTLGGVGAEFASGYGSYLATGDETYLRTSEQLMRSGIIEGLLGAGIGGAMQAYHGGVQKQGVAQEVNNDISYRQANQQKLFDALKAKDYDGFIKIAEEARQQFTYNIKTENKTETKTTTPVDKVDQTGNTNIKPSYREEAKILKKKLEFSRENPEEVERLTKKIEELKNPDYTHPEEHVSDVVAGEPTIDNKIVYVKATKGQLNGTALGVGTKEILFDKIDNSGDKLIFVGHGKTAGSVIPSSPFQTSNTPKEGYIPVQITDEKVDGGFRRKIKILDKVEEKGSVDSIGLNDNKDALANLLQKKDKTEEDNKKIKELQDQLNKTEQAKEVKTDNTNPIDLLKDKLDKLDFTHRQIVGENKDKLTKKVLISPTGEVIPVDDSVGHPKYVTKNLPEYITNGKPDVKKMVSDGWYWGSISKDNNGNYAFVDGATQSWSAKVEKKGVPDKALTGRNGRKKIPKFKLGETKVEKPVVEEVKPVDPPIVEKPVKVKKPKKVKETTNENITVENNVEYSSVDTNPNTQGITEFDEKTKEEAALARIKFLEEKGKTEQAEKEKKTLEANKKVKESAKKTLKKTKAKNTVELIENITPPVSEALYPQAPVATNSTTDELAKNASEVDKGIQKPKSVLYVDKVTKEETEISVEEIKEFVITEEDLKEETISEKDEFTQALREQVQGLGTWTDEKIEDAWNITQDNSKKGSLSPVQSRIANNLYKNLVVSRLMKDGLSKPEAEKKFDNEFFEKPDKVTREFLAKERKNQEEQEKFKQSLDEEVGRTNRYSLSSPVENSITEQEANDFISQLGLPIRVVNTEKVTEDGQSWAGRSDFNLKEGKVSNVRITVNINNIRDVEHLKNVINEELGHIIYNDSGLKVQIKDIINASNIDQSLLDKYKADDLTEESAVKFMADLVDKYDNKSAIDKFITSLKAWFKQTFGLELNESDLSYIASKALRASLKRIEGKLQPNKFSEFENDKKELTEDVTNGFYQNINTLSNEELINKLNQQSKESNFKESISRFPLGLYYLEAINRGLNVPRINGLDVYLGIKEEGDLKQIGGINEIRFSLVDNKNIEEEVFSIDDIFNGTISKEKKDAIKEVAKLRATKLEQDLIVDEKEAWNILKTIKVTMLSGDNVTKFTNLLKNFVQTRSKQKDPPQTRELSARELLVEAQEMLKISNQAYFDFLQSELDILDDKTFESFNNDLKELDDFVKQALNVETFNTNISESELNYEEKIENIQDFARENTDFILEKVNRMRSEVVFNTTNENLQEFMPLMKELGGETLEKRVEHFIDYVNYLLSDIEGLTFKEKRQRLYALHSLFADGYPLYANNFISSSTMEILKTELGTKIFPYIKSSQEASITEKVTGFAANFRRLGTELSNLMFKIVSPFREGTNKSEIVQEKIIKPYLKKLLKSAERISGKRYTQYERNKIGIYSYLVAYKANETQKEGLERNKNYLKESFGHYSNSFDKSLRQAAIDHQRELDNFIKDIDFTREDVIDQLKDLADLDEGMKTYHQGIVDMFNMVKPLSKFNTEFAYGRPFDEWINYVPAFSVRTDSESETAQDKEILSMDSETQALGELDKDKNMQRQGLSATKERTRRLGKNRMLVLNINQLAEGRMRLNLLDIFTSMERRELVNLISEQGSKRKEFLTWLNDKDTQAGRANLIYRTVLQHWRHSIQSASFGSRYDIFINGLTRLVGSVKLSSGYQFFAQGISNVLPFFVTNINNPAKSARFFKALTTIAKYKSGKLDERSTATVKRLLRGIEMRKQDASLDKSVRLNVSGKDIFQAIKASPLFGAIEKVNEWREAIMFTQFKYSDMVSGDPIILAEYLSNEIEAGRGNDNWDGITYNEESFLKALDETERFIGIGGATRRGAFMHNGNWMITTLRNLLTAFSSHRLNNATNFEIEFNNIRNNNVTPEERAKSIRYMAAITAQSISFGAVKWGITIGIFNIIRGLLEEDDNEEKLKKLYQKMKSGGVSQADLKKINAEISMREAIRAEFNKVKDRTENKQLLAVNIAQDTLANSFVIPAGFDFLTNYVVHLVYDKQDEQTFNEVKEEKLATLKKKIKNAKNIGNTRLELELTMEEKRVSSQMAINASFEQKGFIPFDGTYGMAFNDIAQFGDALADSIIKPDVKAMSWYDWSLFAGTAGFMLADVQKGLRIQDKIEGHKMEYDAKIEELKKKAREEYK